MSIKDEFIKYVKAMMEDNQSGVVMSDGAKTYWEILNQEDVSDKPVLTDNGKMILDYLKKEDTLDTPRYWKARDIAEGLFVSSRTVSGAIRKLCTDGFVEKINEGTGPVVYTLTQKGKDFEIEE